MTTTPTPASQPPVEACTGCWKRVEECQCAAVSQPSPARSDKDAERDLFEKAAIFGRKDKFNFRVPGTMARHKVECVVMEPSDVVKFVASILAAKAQESAPSSEGLEAGVTRTLVGVDGLDSLTTYGSPHGTLIRLADAKCVVASAARRATAGTTAAPNGDMKAEFRAWYCEEFSYRPQDISDGYMLGTTAWKAWCEATKRATAGNAAPTEAGSWSLKIDADRSPLHAELASNTATAAPGDLPDEPKQLFYWNDFTLVTIEAMREYGRACITSNAGAAPGWKRVPEMPTLEMQKAAMKAARTCKLENGQPRPLPGGYELWSATYIYRVMLDAAPSNSPAGAKEKE